jgi:predicted metal-binding membrane protein
MLLMLTIGAGSLGWMLIFGAFMAIEKNAIWGARIGRPLGLALIGWSTAIVIANVAVASAPIHARSPALIGSQTGL